MFSSVWTATTRRLHGAAPRQARAGPARQARAPLLRGPFPSPGGEQTHQPAGAQAPQLRRGHPGAEEPVARLVNNVNRCHVDAALHNSKLFIPSVVEHP